MHRLLLLLLSLLVSFSFFMTALSSAAGATSIAITDPGFENNGQGWSKVGTSGFLTGSMSEGVWSGYTNGPDGFCTNYSRARYPVGMPTRLLWT